jgi:hypothetical protein
MTPEEKQKILESANFLLDQLAEMGPEYAELREGLTEFVIKINEPKAIVSINWVDKIQESLNLIEADKIINNDL